MGRLNEISDLINQLEIDFKAEMIFACMTDQQFESNQLIACFDGQLRRVWSKDLSFCEPGTLTTGDKVIFAHLNRDGIYDTLPEALFHESNENGLNSGKEMAKESMRLKNEEKESRTFFQPLENEFFNQRVQLATMENALSEKIFAESLMGLIPDFWIIPNKLPAKYVSKLIKFIPVSQQITGNQTLTAQCLEFILDEKVKVTMSLTEDTKNYEQGLDLSGVIGKSKLGIDTIAGDFINGFFNRLIFEIGPFRNIETENFVKNGKLKAFLDCFYSYFVPVETDIETVFLFETKRNNFVLEHLENDEISYLGLNSVLG